VIDEQSCFRFLAVATGSEDVLTLATAITEHPMDVRHDGAAVVIGTATFQSSEQVEFQVPRLEHVGSREFGEFMRLQWVDQLGGD
jgi:hypothetical protein